VVLLQISFSASLRPSVRLKCIAVRARTGNYRVLCFAAFTTAYGTELRVFYHALTKNRRFLARRWRPTKCV